MASATEILKLIVDADAKGAVTEMGRVGAAADKDLGKADDRLQKVGASMVSAGASMMVGAAVVGAGLYKVAQSASNYGEQVSAATKIFGDDAIPALEDFADAAAETSGISGTAALSAANNFGTFGKAAGLTGKDLTSFSTNLVTLAGDLASFKNTTPEEAVEALGAALRGESEPMRKYGVLMDDASLKAEALALGVYNGTGPLDMQGKILAANSLIMKQTTDAQGDFADTSDSLANRQRELTAVMENVKVAIGEGVLPVAEKGISIIQGLGDAFGKLSPEAQTTVGSILGFGTVAIAAAGGLSFIVGHVIQMKENLGPLTSKMRDAEGNITGIGRAAQAAGLAIGTLVVADVVFNAVNESAGKSKAIMDALNKTIAAGKDSASSPRELAAAFGELAFAEEDALKISGLWETFGTDIVTTFDGAKQEIENAQSAFDKLAKSDPTGAERTLDALQLITDDLERGSGQWQANTEFIERNRESLRLAGEAAAGTAAATDGAAAANGDAAASFGDVGAQAVSASDALKTYTDGLKAMSDPIFGAIDASQGLQDAQRKVMEAQADLTAKQADGSTSAADLEEAQRTLSDAHYAAVKAGFSHTEAMTTLASKLNSGEVSAQQFKDELGRMVAAQQISQGQADLMSWALLGTAAAAQAVGREHPVVNVDAHTGSFWDRIREINGYDIPDKWVEVRSRLSNGVAGLFGGLRAAGGPVNAGQAYVVGEKGPELFMPGKSGTIIPNHHMPSRATPQGGDGASVYNVTVNTVSSQGVERAVMDALAAARRKGMV